MCISNFFQYFALSPDKFSIIDYNNQSHLFANGRHKPFSE